MLEVLGEYFLIAFVKAGQIFQFRVVKDAQRIGNGLGVVVRELVECECVVRVFALMRNDGGEDGERGADGDGQSRLEVVHPAWWRAAMPGAAC